MTPPVDPNEVLMTGENSFIRLSPDGGKTQTDRLSHWRVLWCPSGAGHALFVQSAAHRQAGAHLQRQRRGGAVAAAHDRDLLFPAFADTSLPVIGARSSAPATPGRRRPRLAADERRIRLTWYDCIEPFVLKMPPGFNNRPIGVFSTFFPARSAQVEINGRFATGSPWSEMRGDRQASSAWLGVVGDLGEAASGRPAGETKGVEPQGAIPDASRDRQGRPGNLAAGPWDYLVGGTETETTVRRNRQAIDAVAFRPARAP